jgi:hypothetical protein
MIWYITVFATGVAIGTLGMIYAAPHVERLWRYVDRKYRQIRDLPW